MHRFHRLLLSLVLASFVAESSDAVEVPAARQQSDRTFIESLFAAEEGQVLRQIVQTGAGSRTRGGTTESLSCNRQTEAEYCNQLAFEICRRANRLASEDIAADVIARAFVRQVLSGVPRGEFLDQAIYDAALSKFRAPRPPPARRLADEWGPRVEELRQTLRNRDLATADLRGQLAFAAGDARSVQLNVLQTDFMVRNQPLLKPPPELQERAMLNEMAHENISRNMRAMLAHAYGPLPNFEMGVAQDGKVYVTFELTMASGNSGRVVAEVTPQGNGPFRGPTLNPVAFRPNFPIVLTTAELTPTMACGLGIQERTLDDITLHAKLVEMPGEEPFIALDREGRPGSLIPRERQNPLSPTYIARASDGSANHHVAELQPRPLNEGRAEGVKAQGAGGAVKVPAAPAAVPAPAAAPVPANPNPGTH
jgi:hypothetical protein